MTEWERQKQGKAFEGYAFTFCKAAFLVLLFGRLSLLILSGLATLLYLLAAMRGVREWHCWAKPPWVTIFWGVVFVGQCALLVLGQQTVSRFLHHLFRIAG